MESATMAANIPLHTFFEGMAPDESPTRSYQLHGVNEEAFGVNSQSYGIVYQGKRDKSKHYRQGKQYQTDISYVIIHGVN